MSFVHPWALIDNRLNRFFSLSLVLLIGLVLLLAKLVLLFGGAHDKPEPPREQSTETSVFPELELDPTHLADDKFIPWPETLPEPAAGPETTANSASDADADGLGSFDPSTLTEGEITALKQLMARRQALDERETMLDMRAELNMLTESRLDQQIEKLTELRNQLAALTKDLDDAEERRIARLVKIYETMKPKAAAAIFNRLEITILIHVIDRMKEAKSAAVLAKMDPAIAKRVTTELAKKKDRPSLGGKV